MSSETPFWPLTQTVFASILEVFLLCIAGFILAKKGILDKKTQRQINRLNVSLFTPSLLFSKVAFFLSPQKLRELWIIPIFFVIVTLCSMAVAFFLSFALRLKRSQRSFAVAASMFMNSNSLPIALMQSLVVTVPGLKWDEDDNQNVMLGRALSYLVLYSTLGMVVRWSYGVNLLSRADPEGARAQDQQSHRLLQDDQLPPQDRLPVEETTLHSDESSDGEQAPAIHISVRSPALRVNRPHLFYSFPNTPAMSVVRLPPGDMTNTTTPAISDYESEGDEHIAYRPTTAPTTSKFHSSIRRMKRRICKALTTFNDFMTAPLWAALASITVACVQPLQHALDRHAQPLKGALDSAGHCSIPLTLVVLGAYFCTPAQQDESQDLSNRHALDGQNRSRGFSATTTSQLSLVGSFRRGMLKMSGSRRALRSLSIAPKDRQKSGETKTVVVALLSRMVIAPLLLLPLMAVCAKYDWQDVFADPVFVLSNVLLVSSPPALTLAQITQAASGDAFERLISRTIFWAYCILTPPATIFYVVVGLKLIRI